jgi:hypothetical protein
MISILEYFHKSIKIQKNPKENKKKNNKLKYIKYPSTKCGWYRDSAPIQNTKIS